VHAFQKLQTLIGKSRNVLIIIYRRVSSNTFSEFSTYNFIKLIANENLVEIVLVHYLVSSI